MTKKCLFFIDDVIWVFRDLARKKPASLFADPFLSVMKSANEKFGIKTQLNVFYSTDSYYGNDYFDLSEMPDIYKEEFINNSSWFKLAFHSEKEFPDYPYLNASYEQVNEDFLKIEKEIGRFAGAECFTKAIVPHWYTVSYEGCRALYDRGVRLMSGTCGKKSQDDSLLSSLSHKHAQRLLCNRKPESGVFSKNGVTSLCGYNHTEDVEAYENTMKNLKVIKDEKTGLAFKCICNGVLLNTESADSLKKKLSRMIEEEYEYIGVGNHEQYFHKDYFAYQPDYTEKIMVAAEMLKAGGYECIFLEDII